MSAAEHVFGDLLAAAHLLAGHELPDVLRDSGAALGLQNATAYLTDLQQDVLVPFRATPGTVADPDVLTVDATLAGRAYQHVEVLTQDEPDGGLRVWLPLLNGSERLGVVTGILDVPPDESFDVGGSLVSRLRRLAAVIAELIVTKSAYGDTIVRLRRRADLGLAAEMQWSLLPPLTFACDRVTVAAALEPAYEVAGDTVDYAVDPGVARVAVFDGMGHGLQSAQLATLAVAAYRNARRSQRGLVHTAREIDDALVQGFDGNVFSTALIAELDTNTGRLAWINAGHPEPLLLRDGRLVKTLHVESTLPLGLGYLGGDDDVTGSVAVGSEQLEPGDRLLLYTDGVIEARSPDGEFFGSQRLADLVTRNLAGGLPTPETMRRVVRALLAHQRGRLSDDATMLLLEWRTGNEQALLPDSGMA